jgi:hypothetical protein
MARQHSTPDTFSLTPQIIERFWQNVTRCDHGDQCGKCCWLWHGYAKKPVGRHASYGRFFIYPYQYPAHRVSYILTYGYIFPGLYICHRCDVPLCVNPQHLWAGTPTENVHDTIRKGRARYFPSDAHKKLLEEHPEYVFKGEQINTAKLTAEQVYAIRSAYKHGESRPNLRTRFGVGKSAIDRILQRKSWKHLPEEDN